jgi:hypothetical protein
MVMSSSLDGAALLPRAASSLLKPAATPPI